MVRVRFAPSPTGYLHVGNTRTALANYLFARKEGGILVLRVEDTDVERSEAAYEAALLEDLRWLGIAWDEGPYRQSDRTDIYRAHIETLLEKGLAYKCFCSKERLEEMRKQAQDKGEPPKYDGACRDLDPDAVRDLEKTGKPYVVRFRAFKKVIRVRDLIHGEIQFPADHVDDFILLKQELTPSYNFAVTVDDMLMDITHVIRGADHISNTPKQIMLFQAFGQEPPRYAHHSLLTGHDQKPLSKRHGATHVREFRDMGILRQALTNYVGILGRNVSREIMDEEELIETFSLSSLSPSDSLFDLEKLVWFNKEYIRKLPTDSILLEMGLPAGYRDKVALLQENARTLGEIRQYLDIFEGTGIEDEGSAYLSEAKNLPAIVASLNDVLEDGDPSFEKILRKLEETGLKRREFFMTLRVICTGRKNGPPLKDVFPLIGKDMITRRVSWVKARFSLP